MRGVEKGVPQKCALLFLRTFSENFNYEGWLFAKICYQK